MDTDLSVERQYAEEAGMVLSAMGLPPAYGKILAWLLICDPPSQTVTQMADALGLSKGSVSAGAKLLESSGLIRRVAAAGRRGTYYEMTADAIIRAAGSEKFTIFRQLMERGLSVIGDPEGPRAERLRMTRDFYALIEREVPKLIKQFMEQYHTKGDGDG